MKKVRLYTLLLGACMLLTACGGNKPKTQKQSVPAEKTARVASRKRAKKAKPKPKRVEEAQPATQNARSKAVQAVLAPYAGNSAVGVAYLDLTTGASAGVNADAPFYAASVAKLPIVAFVQSRLISGKLSETTAFAYSESANDLPNAMLRGGTGTLQYENHAGKSYTVSDLLQRTIVHSDNQASNQLLNSIALANPEDFSHYLAAVWETKSASYSKTMTANQANKTINAIWAQHGQARAWLQQTDWAHDKIGALNVPVAHKIGINGAANNDAAIVQGPTPFALTIMTNGWSDAQISALAQQVYDAAQTPVE